jgi:hypothetical protein
LQSLQPRVQAREVATQSHEIDSYKLDKGELQKATAVLDMFQIISRTRHAQDAHEDAREGEQAADLQHLLEGIQIEVDSLSASRNTLFQSEATPVYRVR